jgi:hypothetical protein
MKLVILAVAAAMFTPATVLAQHEHPAGAKLGTVNFETSCQPATRPDFNHGMALLHSFEFGPAIESFNKVLAADPNCAIAYWGIALSQWSNPFAGIKTGPLLERASPRRRRGWRPATRRRAKRRISTPSTSSTPTRRRSRTATARLPMRRRWRPCSASIATTSRRGSSTRSRSNQTALPTDKTVLDATAGRRRILEPLWKKFPDHPGLAHYIIHTTTCRCWRRRR